MKEPIFYKDTYKDEKNNLYTFYLERWENADYARIYDAQTGKVQEYTEDECCKVLPRLLHYNEPIYYKNREKPYTIEKIPFADLPIDVQQAFNPKTELTPNEPDWKTLRIRMAENFMANMLNADETFRTKLVDDILYKQLARFSVACADVLIEELNKN